MTTHGAVSIDVYLDDAVALATMAREIRDGLTSTPKSLPSKYFYDERGSELFEEITRLPEYYLTRAERRLLDELSGEVARLTRPVELVELGSGSATKTRLLIQAARSQGALERFVPVDVSRELVESTAHELAELYPGLEVHAIVGDFETHLERVPEGERRLVALLGSTLGNFPENDAIVLLRGVLELLGPGDALLLGVDLVKDPATIEAAYNDSRGVTAEFNRNILNVINERLDADFDPRNFEHRSHYNETEQRIETWLQARKAATVHVGGADITVRFDAGEMMRTEVSCKYTRASLQRILASAGLRLTHWFPAGDLGFALSLSTPI